ncbi:alpha/beta hydrolase family protein [Parasphingorhabdus halotolerans]|uniref:Xaa-Pro dipeptidyl-peptidase-like domain-containing protein n=1 Tax=Parasphingorhabdus halotolerans TaxID=2725558 RepID=A0A6H2DMP4_9SPHN|nr:CocE/NonD family hydrolase [Parasphingorhabdus halotolerans]QJB69942.1 hypothetical protein HF685_12135 [Parasphingorhabdus halotolerans]
MTSCAQQIAAQDPVSDPYAVLRQAYAERDAERAAAAYVPDATLTYDYGDPIEKYEGSAAIARSFDDLFKRVDPELKLDLNFRTANSKTAKGRIEENGVYRLRFGDAETSFGTFKVVREATGQGRFISDFGTSATVDDFESLPGPVRLDQENEELDSAYYGTLTGRYKLDDQCDLIITHSIVRMFARNSCTNDWQGLNRKSGRIWTGGDRVLSDKELVAYEFFKEAEGADVIRIRKDNKITIAKKQPNYTREAVSFQSRDGLTLAGDLYRPANPNGLAMVLVHGSGPQDRNGYASIMAVTAEALAQRGHIVLTYDKRGVEKSQGDWSKMGFADLASDAISAMDWLAMQQDVGSNIGFAGSSQAGWVVAKAIEQGAKPGHVHLLGAAGSALTVEEQNLYNTEVRMRCAGIVEAEIRMALDQQEEFFKYVRTRSNPEKLDGLTKRASVYPALRDWLFPSSADVDFDAGDWFTTLELAFDPIPVWQDYDGRAVFVFSEYDDSTPTALATKRLEKLPGAKNGNFEIINLPGTQHIGLKADSVCKAGLGDVSGFNGLLFESFDRLASLSHRKARPD